MGLELSTSELEVLATLTEFGITNSESLDLDQIYELCGQKYRKHTIILIVGKLYGLELLDRDSLVNGKWVYYINEQGMIHTATQTNNTNFSLQIPASDRYVSIKDNQKPFDRVEKSLDEIVAEFAKAHNKHNSSQSDEAHFLRASIAAFKAQLREGYVSIKLLKEDLLERLKASQGFFSSLPGIKLLIDEAIKALRALLELLG